MGKSCILFHFITTSSLSGGLQEVFVLLFWSNCYLNSQLRHFFYILRIKLIDINIFCASNFISVYTLEEKVF